VTYRQLAIRTGNYLDAAAQAFKHRPLTKVYKYLFLDAMCVKVKEGRFATERMVPLAVGIDEFGYKEVIGFCRSRRESAAAWRRLLSNLVERGLDYNSLDLVISDEAKGIALAIDDVFGDVPHQLCWAHRMTNL
jgi:transposase-like protein